MASKKDDFKKKISANIKKYRNIANLTQRELSIQADVIENHIYMIESGRRTPSIDIIWDIANALNVEPYELLK